MKKLGAVAVMLGVAACVGGPQEPRQIDVSNSTIEPASNLINNIDGLLAKTGPSYVTLVVHDSSRPGNRSRRKPDDGCGYIRQRICD